MAIAVTVTSVRPWGDIMESTADKASAGAKRAGVSAHDWRMTEVANAMKRGMTRSQ
jgi:hypothetical protein